MCALSIFIAFKKTRSVPNMLIFAKEDVNLIKHLIETETSEKDMILNSLFLQK